MNHVLYSLTFLLSFSWFSTFGTVPDTSVCLKLEGIFENAFYRNNRPCQVEVITGGRTVDVVTLDKIKRKFRYYFARDSYYTLRITKEGFVPLIIDVDTRCLETSDVIYQFKFTTRLITEKRAFTLNKRALLLPYTVIRYFPKKRNFHYDEEYTEALKRELTLTPSLQITQSLPYWLRKA